MASSVFYKFNSRRDESRVSFDGTGISVFDLKREIILANNMGKANDFDLFIYDATSKQGESPWLAFCLAGSLRRRAPQSSKMTRQLFLVHPQS